MKLNNHRPGRDEARASRAASPRQNVKTDLACCSSEKEPSPICVSPVEWSASQAQVPEEAAELARLGRYEGSTPRLRVQCPKCSTRRIRIINSKATPTYLKPPGHPLDQRNFQKLRHAPDRLVSRSELSWGLLGYKRFLEAQQPPPRPR